MSATVVRQPEAWIKSMERLKADIVAGRDDADVLTPNLKVGVSTNFNKLVSCRQAARAYYRVHMACTYMLLTKCMLRHQCTAVA